MSIEDKQERPRARMILWYFVGLAVTTYLVGHLLQYLDELDGCDRACEAIKADQQPAGTDRLHKSSHDDWLEDD